MNASVCRREIKLMGFTRRCHRNPAAIRVVDVVWNVTVPDLLFLALLIPIESTSQMYHSRLRLARMFTPVHFSRYHTFHNYLYIGFDSNLRDFIPQSVRPEVESQIAGYGSRRKQSLTPLQQSVQHVILGRA